MSSPALFLTDTLPLRTTRQLGDYAVDAPLSLRFGDLSHARFDLLQLTSTDYFAADHPMPITVVFVDTGSGPQITTGWEQQTRSDTEGNTYTVVVLAAPPADGSTVSATGTGMRSPRTGVLIENPGDICAEIMRRAGRSETFYKLRAETAAAGIRLGMSISAFGSVQSLIDSVVQSAGAVWALGDGRIYPADVSGGTVRLDKMNAGSIEVSTSLVETADVLRLTYDHSDAGTGRAQHFIELTANPKRYGGVVLEREFPLIHLPGVAEQVGRRALTRLASERYDVRLASSRTDIRPGMWLDLAGHPGWPLPGGDPMIFVLEVQAKPHSRSCQVYGETMLSAPQIKVTAHSIALDDTTQGGIDVSYNDGIAKLHFTDKNGKPIAGARVSLDSGPAKVTDQTGLVEFDTPPGRHTLVFQATGFSDQQIEFTL